MEKERRMLRASRTKLVVGSLVVLTILMLVTLVAWTTPSFVDAKEAEDVSDLLAKYPVSGRPHAVAVEASNRIWFTLPEENLIGRLVVTSTTDYRVDTYQVPTSDSYPYDLNYAGGNVWFTELQGNKIGRLSPDTGTFIEYDIGTPNSQPTGIDVLPGTTTYVWFAERGGDRLGQLMIPNTGPYQLTEHSLPGEYAGAKLQDVAIVNADSIWFTAPGIESIGRFKPSSFSPFVVRKIPGAEPWSIDLGEGNTVVWFTDRAGHRVGAYFPQTITDFRWFEMSTPYGLTAGQGNIWITSQTGQRVAKLDPLEGRLRKFSVDGGELRGVDVDSNGHAWIADFGREHILEWRPPYFHKVHLPLALRSAQ